MSPTNVSCGRKRSLLRTFGSRRRHKDFAVSASIRSEEAVSATTTNKCDESAKPGSVRYSPIRENSTVPTTPLKGHGDSYNAAHRTPMSGGTPCKHSNDCSRDAYRLPASPFKMHPVMMTRTSQNTRDPEISAAKRSSMADARASEVTFATRRYTTNSMQLGDKADRIRLLDSSVYSCDKDGTLLNKSHVPSSVPLTAVQRELVGQRTSSAKALSAHGHPASKAEIHYKVVQMVAAMDALKPSTPTTTPTRKATNARSSSHVAQSKGFAKLLGRLYSKSASPESEAFKKRSRLGTGEKVSSLTRSASQPDTDRPTVSSTEIRLNVDQNLDKDKVQQMMGVQSICQGSASTFVRSHSCGQLAMGVGTEDDLEVGEESGHGPGHGSRRTSWSSPNPFDTEEDFECDLDQGILHVSPAGSSTPRIRIHRSSESSAS